jgi:conjugal transfer mating pair stabilization protein TraG
MLALTIYYTGFDVTLLGTILNAVAMIANESTFIWGFALLAVTYTILATITKTAIAAGDSGNGGSAYRRGVVNAFLPFVFAIILTNIKCTVTIESTASGRTRVVDNVPVAIAIIPAVGSSLAKELGRLMGTAFQSASADYPSLSANNSGFMNPLRSILGARQATLKMGHLAVITRNVVDTCIGTASGVDMAEVSRVVMNQGNLPADVGKNIVVDSGAGPNPTSIGALLWYAAQVPTIKVQVGSDLLSCSAAANYVADQIKTQLQTTNFSRAATGALSGMDQVGSGQATTFERLTATHESLRKFQTVTGNLAQGTGQARAEMINMLFYDMVENNLQCAQAGDEKATCAALASQSLDMERHNMAMAAAASPTFKYAGAFGQQILALIIGIGPVVLMFMMFMGVGADKSMKTAAHMIAWPMLVMNVGAEVVNNMILTQVSTFMSDLSNGGFLSHNTVAEAYRNLSLQVGTASNIMASLPVLMSMIFGLGQTAAMTSVAEKMTPKAPSAADVGAPEVLRSAPAAVMKEMGSFEQTASGSTVMKQTGALDSMNHTSQLMASTGQFSVIKANQKAASEATSKDVSFIQSTAKELLASENLSKYFSANEIKSLEAVRNSTQGITTNNTKETGVNSASSTATSTNLNAGANVGGSLGLGLGNRSGNNGNKSTPSAGFQLGGSLSATTGVNAADVKSSSESSKKTQIAAQSDFVAQMIAKRANSEIGMRRSSDKQAADKASIQKLANISTKYSQTETDTTSTSATLTATKSVSEDATKIGLPQLSQIADARPADMSGLARGAEAIKLEASATDEQKQRALERTQNLSFTQLLPGSPNEDLKKDLLYKHELAQQVFNTGNDEQQDAANAYLRKSGEVMTMRGSGSLSLDKRDSVPETVKAQQLDRPKDPSADVSKLFTPKEATTRTPNSGKKSATPPKKQIAPNPSAAAPTTSATGEFNHGIHVPAKSIQQQGQAHAGGVGADISAKTNPKGTGDRAFSQAAENISDVVPASVKKFFRPK